MAPEQIIATRAHRRRQSLSDRHNFAFSVRRIACSTSPTVDDLFREDRALRPSRVSTNAHPVPHTSPKAGRVTPFISDMAQCRSQSCQMQVMNKIHEKFPTLGQGQYI